MQSRCGRPETILLQVLGEALRTKGIIPSPPASNLQFVHIIALFFTFVVASKLFATVRQFWDMSSYSDSCEERRGLRYRKTEANLINTKLISSIGEREGLFAMCNFPPPNIGEEDSPYRRQQNRFSQEPKSLIKQE